MSYESGKKSALSGFGKCACINTVLLFPLVALYHHAGNQHSSMRLGRLYFSTFPSPPQSFERLFISFPTFNLAVNGRAAGDALILTFEPGDIGGHGELAGIQVEARGERHERRWFHLRSRRW